MERKPVGKLHMMDGVCIDDEQHTSFAQTFGNATFADYLIESYNENLDKLHEYEALGSIERVEAVLKAADACHEMWLKNGSHCATDEQWPDDTTNEYYTLSRAVRALREKPTEEKPERKSRDDILVEAAKNVQRACAGIITALTQRPDDR